MSDTEDWRPLIEVAACMGVSSSKLSKLVKEGKLKSKKMMRDRRVTWLDLVQVRTLFNEEMQR